MHHQNNSYLKKRTEDILIYINVAFNFSLDAPPQIYRLLNLIYHHSLGAVWLKIWSRYPEEACNVQHSID